MHTCVYAYIHTFSSSISVICIRPHKIADIIQVSCAGIVQYQVRISLSLYIPDRAFMGNFNKTIKLLDVFDSV